MALGFWHLMPDPFRFQVAVNCRRCWHTNRLPWYWGFGLTMAGVLLSLFVVVVSGGLLLRHGLWPAPSGWRALVGIPYATAVVVVCAVLCVRLYFTLVRQPFVVPRSRRKG